jgi:hypothetical protein
MFSRRTCARCGRVLPLAEVAGGRLPKFCGTACRVAAHRARSVPPTGGFATAPGAASMTPPRGARAGNKTPAQPRLEARGAFKSPSSPPRTGADRNPTGRLKMAWRAPDGARIAVLPDPVWSRMFRVHRAEHVSDMTNLSRARDAAQVLADPGRRR